MPQTHPSLQEIYHHILLGRVDLARQQCEALISQSQDLEEAHTLLGLIDAESNQPEKAAENLLRALLASSQTPESLKQIGLTCLRQKKPGLAIAFFEKTLRSNPRQPDVWIWLGQAHTMQGTIERAQQSFAQAIQFAPNHPDGYSQLALIFQKTGKLQEALALYEKGLPLAPRNADILCNYALALHQAGQVDKAEAVCRDALRINPSSLEAYLNLGVILASRRQFDDAHQAFAEAIKMNPTHPQAMLSMGNILLEKQQYRDALGWYEKLLPVIPNNPDLMINMGMACKHLGEMDRAEACFRKAISLNPQKSEAYYNLGLLYRLKDDFGQAFKMYQLAVKHNPRHAASWNNLGLIYSDQILDIAEAHRCYQKAIEANPQLPEAFNNLADSLLNLNRPEEALTAYQRSLALKPRDEIRVKEAVAIPRFYQTVEEIQHWRNRAMDSVKALRQEKLNLTNPVDIGAPTFFWAYHGLGNYEIQHELGQLFADNIPLHSVVHPRNKTPRIGFISRYFMPTHTIAKVFFGLIEQLARQQFDIVVFNIGHTQPLPINAPFQQVNLGVSSLEKAMEAVENAQLDLLCYTDLGMDPLTYFLSFHRLARVQCVTWGHPETSGSPNVDYYISTRLFETEASPKAYTETLIRMDTVPTYYPRPEPIQERLTAEDFGYRSQDRLYLCPQSLFKFHPDFDDILGNLLRADPQGQLVLANAAYKIWTPMLENRLKTKLPDVADRIRILDNMPYDRFLNLLNIAHVMIDTLHFGGGSTTYEALSLGTPIVTLPTQFLRGRMAYGLYQKIGVTDAIADTADAYVEKAVAIATQPDYRQELSERIKANHDVLYSEQAAVDEMARLFMELIERHTE